MFGASRAEALTVVVFTGEDTEDESGSVSLRHSLQSPPAPSDLRLHVPSSPIREGVGQAAEQLILRTSSHF